MAGAAAWGGREPIEAGGRGAMDQPWWGSVVQWGAWGVLMALVMGWIGRSRLRARPRSQSDELRHPPSTLIVGGIGLVFFGGCAVMSNLFPNRTVTWWTTAIFVGFALLFVLLIADYFLARHTVSEAGLSYGRLMGRRGYLRWSDLRRVTYAPSMKWFRLEGRSGDVARISVMLLGLPVFAQVVLAQAPPAAIAPETRAILEATAAGDPPSVWA